MIRDLSFRLLLLLGIVLVWVPPDAQAATNAARAGIGGIANGTVLGGDGTGTAVVVLNVVDLALVKQARDPAGLVLPSGGSVAAGSDVWFVLYVDNPTTVPADGLQLDDALDETAFTYVPGTLAWTSLPAGASDAATWSATWTPLTDDRGAPDDLASILDSGGAPGRDRLTVGAVTGQLNQGVSIPPQSRFAVRFRVRVQ